MSKKTIVLILVVVTLALFCRTVGHDFINYDDPAYVTGNPHVVTGLTLENVKWAFSTTHLGNWHPLTWLSHMADCQLFGLNPAGHHFSSLLLHVAGTVLLFLFLSMVTAEIWPSAAVALLFAIHPLHVESVAWVSERKDVLSTFFMMLTLLAYAAYTRRRSAPRYLAVAALFALGLMAKQMLVTLPFVLLLLDYWPLARHKEMSLRALALEKLPLLALSAAASVATFIVQKAGNSVSSLEKVPLLLRIENSIVSYAWYLVKTVWPSGLAPFYPLPADYPLWQVAAAFLLLAAISALVFLRARRFPFLPVGWLWFLGTLVPVIGLVQVGNQARADRYSYIPLIGIFLIVSFGAAALADRWRDRPAALAAPALVAAALAVCTFIQLGHWRNKIVLFSHAIEKTTGNYVAHASLGWALSEQGRFAEAVYHYEEAIKGKPDDPDAHLNLGCALQELGRVDEAVHQYREVLRLTQGEPKAYLNLGIAMIAKGNLREGVGYYYQALRLKPDYADAHLALGIALQDGGYVSEAVKHYYTAIAAIKAELRIYPGNPAQNYNLQLALQKLAEAGRLKDS